VIDQPRPRRIAGFALVRSWSVRVSINFRPDRSSRRWMTHLLDRATARRARSAALEDRRSGPSWKCSDSSKISIDGRYSHHARRRCASVRVGRIRWPLVHPEGTRERPYDSPATGRPIGHGANSDQVESRSGADDEGL